MVKAGDQFKLVHLRTSLYRAPTPLHVLASGGWLMHKWWASGQYASYWNACLLQLGSCSDGAIFGEPPVNTTGVNKLVCVSIIYLQWCIRHYWPKAKFSRNQRDTSLVRCEIFFTYTSVYYIKNNMCHEITLLELLIPLSYPEITYSS